ncbi:MAG TPA: MFS transporter, partial [Phytomonospora sp.]
SASALTNVAQQIGGSIGAALMNTVAISASTAYVAANGPGDPAAAATHGQTTAFTWSAGFLVLALLAVVLLVRSPKTRAAEPQAEETVAA